MKCNATGMCALLAAVLCSFSAYAGMPSPYLRLSFDREFYMEGAGVKTLKIFPGAPFPGVAKTPAGEFVAGVSGKAFIPKEDLIFQGDAVFPAPEGTVSLWIKPVKYQEDWIGGPLLTPGRIGSFLRVLMNGESESCFGILLVRQGRHDCCSGLHWYEAWPSGAIQYFVNGPNVPFNVWQDNKWRMLTVVWFKGERRIYFNGVRIQHGVNISRNPTKPGNYLSIPAGSKAVDELTVWDRPLSDAQVAALFFSQMPQSGLKGAIQQAPRLSVVPEIGQAERGEAWKQAAKSSTWIDSFSGMASDAKDILEMGHRDGWLFIRYREPMPENYIAVKTLLGGAMLKRSVPGAGVGVERDGNVWDDDCVEVRLTGDNGKTNYVLAVSASGALYDERNGDKEFNVNTNDWVVWQDAGEKFWTVEMKLNLAALSGGKAPEEWGFNFVRTVKQQGFARRQWSFDAGSAYRYSRLMLSGSEQMPVTAELDWLETTGQLSATMEGSAETPVTASYSVVPLGFLALFPEEEKVEGTYRLPEVIRATHREDKLSPAVQSEQHLSKGAVNWQGKLDYVGEGVALASLAVKDDAGKALASRAFLVGGSQMVSTRLYNLPSRRELVAQVFLASETLAGKDVVADIAIMKQGETKPVLQTRVDGFKGIMAETAMDVSGIPVGAYGVEVTVAKGGKLLGKRSNKWFKSGDPEWLGNAIGIIKSVPAPWTPVKQQGARIEVWGRSHSFAGSLLPASMKVLDEEILAGPMRLIIKAGDETLDTAKVDNPLIVIDKAGIKAEITGKATGKTLVVEVKGELEFDGFGYFTFTLKPVDAAKPVSVQSIVFEVPFKKKYAELYDDASYDMFGTQSGRVPAEGMQLSGPGTVRVGDTSRGVQFAPFFEKLGKRTAAKPLSFTPTADAMTMRYIVSEGVTINGPVTNQIGLIGTPVKPYDAKRIRMTGHAGPAISSNLQEQGYSSASYWTATWSNFRGGTGAEDTYYNFTPEWCEGLAKSRKSEWDKNRMYAALYLSPTVTIAQTPEYAYFWKEWGGQYYEGLEEYMLDLSLYRGADVRSKGSRTGGDFWAYRSYQDFYFYALDKILGAFAKEGVRVGVYVDNTTGGGTDLRPYRRWVQRLHQVVRKHSPDGLIIIHMSGTRVMALWSMVDMLAEGEQYSANWSAYMVNKPELTLNDCFPTVLPLDRVRATYTATLWGPQEVFLSQLWTDPRQQEDVHRKEKGDPGPSYYKRMRYITGLMLVHDTPFWGEFYGCGVKEDPWIKRARWGYDATVKFIPYWDNNGMLTVESPDKTNIVASAWLRPDGNLMAIVFNNTTNAVSVRLKVDAPKSPVKLKEFVRAVDITSPVAAFNPDATKPDTYAYKGGVVEVDMRPRDFRLLVFEQ